MKTRIGVLFLMATCVAMLPAQAPTISVQSAANFATSTGVIAPGDFVVIYLTGFTGTPTITMGGTVPYLYYASATQTNAVAPTNLPAIVPIVVTSGSVSATLNISSAATDAFANECGNNTTGKLFPVTATNTCLVTASAGNQIASRLSVWAFITAATSYWQRLA